MASYHLLRICDYETKTSRLLVRRKLEQLQ